jgi:hypothetical protein
MKKRVLKSRVNEIMKRKMPTCYFNAVTSRFMGRIPKEVGRLYDRYARIRFGITPFVLSRMIEESIKAGQRMLPRKAKDWEKRGMRGYGRQVNHYGDYKSRRM